MDLIRPEWWPHRACADVPTEVFFPQTADGEYDEGGEYAAKAVCSTCPVRICCLNYAIVEGLREGIYGGVGEYTRRRMRRVYKATG